MAWIFGVAMGLAVVANVGARRARTRTAKVLMHGLFYLLIAVALIGGAGSDDTAPAWVLRLMGFVAGFLGAGYVVIGLTMRTKGEDLLREQ